MKQGSTLIDTSEGFYSKTPASRLANKEIIKGKKLNVLNPSKKLQNKDIEANKVIEINTMKSEQSIEDNPKEDQNTMNSNTQHMNLITGQNTQQTRDYSNCQSALLKKKRNKFNHLKDEIESNIIDINGGDSQTKIQSILPNKDLNVFKRLEQKAFKVMETMDEKMIEALQRKEYEIVKSFQTTISRLMNELSQLNEKSKNENLALLRDHKIISLEKQVAFFRDQSYQLNNQMKDMEQEMNMILKINTEKDEEILNLQRTLKNVKAKLINTSSILDSQMQQQSPLSNNKKTDSTTFMLTQQAYHNSALKIYPHTNMIPSSILANKPTSPYIQSKLPDLHPQFQNTMDNNINTQNKNDLYGQSIINQNSSMLNQNVIDLFSQTPQNNKIQSGSTQIDRTYQKKTSATNYQSEMINDNQESSDIYDLSSKKVLDTKTNNKSINGQDSLMYNIAGDPSTVLDIEALVSVYIQDKESQYLIKNALMTYVSNKFKVKNQIITTLQKQLTDLKLNLAYFNQIQNDSNELEQLFSTAVEDMRAAILKRNNYQNAKFSQSDRVDLISKFMSSEKFIQIVKAKIFNKKCCENQNCLFNINTMEKRTNSLLKQYGTSEQVKNYYASIRDLSMDDKINNILDMQIERSSTKFQSSDGGQQSLFQKWKQMNNISSKYKNEGSMSAMNNNNNSLLNQSDSKEYSSLIFDQIYLKEMQKNQQKIYRMNNQFRRMFKDEKIQDKEIDDRLTGFINEAIHKLEFEDPKLLSSTQMNNKTAFSHGQPLNSNLNNQSFSNQQPQHTQSGEKTRSQSIKVQYRHGKLYN